MQSCDDNMSNCAFDSLNKPKIAETSDIFHGNNKLALDLCYVTSFCVMGTSHMNDCLMTHSICSMMVDLSCRH